MGAPESELDALVAELRHEVERRRAETGGDAAALDEAFAARREDEARLADALERLADVRFSRGQIATTSGLPGGGALHRAVAKVVGRQIDGTLAQSEEHALAVREVVTLLAELVARPVAGLRELAQQVDDLQARAAEQQRELNRLRGLVERADPDAR